MTKTEKISRPQVEEKGEKKESLSRAVKVLSSDTSEQLKTRAQTTTTVLQRFLDLPVRSRRV